MREDAFFKRRPPQKKLGPNPAPKLIFLNPLTQREQFFRCFVQVRLWKDFRGFAIIL